MGDEAWVTIAGERLVHMLYVFVLPLSNWTWATVCWSESTAALRRGAAARAVSAGAATEVAPDGQLDVGHRLATKKSASDISRPLPTMMPTQGSRHGAIEVVRDRPATGLVERVTRLASVRTRELREAPASQYSPSCTATLTIAGGASGLSGMVGGGFTVPAAAVWSSTMEYCPGGRR